MILLQVVGVIVALILLVVALIVLENWRYRFYRYRTGLALAALKERIDDVRCWLPVVPAQQLAARVTEPLTRLETAFATLQRRAESLEKDNDLRLGPHTRSEWRHLNIDVRSILRRARLACRYFGMKGQRDNAWPFVAGHTAFYSDENYTWQKSVRYSRRGFHGHGALDEPIIPSAAECQQMIGSVATGNRRATYSPAPSVVTQIPPPGSRRRKSHVPDDGKRGEVVQFTPRKR